MSAGWATELTPLAVAIPIVASSALLVARSAPRLVLDAVSVTTTAVVVAIDAALVAAASHGRVVTWAGGWRPTHGFAVGIVLVVDEIGAGAALVAGGLVVCALVYAARFFDEKEAHFNGLMLLFLAGMQGFALTGDVFDMFVFFELMGAVAYALAGLRIEDPKSVHGALNFGIVNSLGAYLSLSGVALLYARTGQLGLPQLGVALAAHRPDGLVVAGFVLVLTGFLVKGAVVPFHFWLADAHAVAPTPVCVLFSGVMVELGLYGVARVASVAFGGALPRTDMHRALLTLGLATAVLGSVMCFAQRHLKRMLAYSTIAHTGLFLAALSALDPSGTAGAALYIAGHAGVKGALFLLAGVVLNRWGSVDEHGLFGRGRGERLMPALWLLGGLALAGLPPFGTALGKGVSEASVAHSIGPVALAVFVGCSIVTGGAVLRATARIYGGWGPRPVDQTPAGAETTGEEGVEVSTPMGRVPTTMLIPIFVLLAGGLAVGVVPGTAAAFGRAGAQFSDRAGYIAQALRGVRSRLPPAPRDVGWSSEGVALGLLSALGAVGVAALGLYAPRLPRLVRRAGSSLRPGLIALRRLHSGHIGDYVAWLLLGVAGLAALIGVPLR